MITAEEIKLLKDHYKARYIVDGEDKRLIDGRYYEGMRKIAIYEYLLEFNERLKKGNDERKKTD